MSYEQGLSAIPFFCVHPEYKPFIGEKYDEHKILIVGESHYIGQTADNILFPLDYFDSNWWGGSCDELNKAYLGWYTTRDVIANYRTGERHRGHSIFTNCIKSFSKVILNEPIERISTEESQKISYFAFMNFFQMPSLFKGMKFWNSLKKAAATIEAANSAWDTAVEESSRVLDDVIDVIRPRRVIFVSRSAYCAYKGSSARHKDDPIVAGTCHPGSAYWYKKNNNGTCGRDEFEKYLIH